MKSAIRAAALAAGFSAVSAFGADIPAAGPTALSAAIGRAAPGDRILVAPGRYGALVVTARRFGPAVKIEAADAARPPQFASMRITDSAGLHFANVAIVFGATAKPEGTRAVEIGGSRDIAFSKSSFAGAVDGVANDPIGLFVRDSSRIRIAESKFHDLWRGAAIHDSTDWRITASEFRLMSSDGIVGRGAVDARIEDNLFTELSTDLATGVHPDAIQFWDRDAARAIDGLVIARNFILRGRGGPSQGIFINGENPALTSKNIRIEDNVIHQSMGQGILVKTVDGAVIRNNTVAPFDPAQDAPGIEARAPFANVVVERNLYASLRLADMTPGAGNLLLDYDNPWIATYAEKLLANPRSGAPAKPADFRASGSAGARIADSYGYVPPEDQIVRVFPKVVLDLSFRNLEPVDASREPVAFERAADGSLAFAASPKWTGMPALEIHARARRTSPAAGWEYLVAAPGAYDVRINADSILFSVTNGTGATTRLSAPIDMSAPRDLRLRYDGYGHFIEIHDGGRLVKRAAAPDGLVAYKKTGKLHVGGAPWGPPFSGEIERLEISR